MPPLAMLISRTPNFAAQSCYPCPAIEIDGEFYARYAPILADRPAKRTEESRHGRTIEDKAAYLVGQGRSGSCSPDQASFPRLQTVRDMSRYCDRVRDQPATRPCGSGAAAGSDFRPPDRFCAAFEAASARHRYATFPRSLCLLVS